MTRETLAQQSRQAEQTPGARRGFRFTGWHMLTILVVFFGIVIAVNVVMARFAISTFGGEVVENSYVASQHFNSWLDEAKAERDLGWNAGIHQNGKQLEVSVIDSHGKPLGGAKVTAHVMHPLGLEADRDLTFTEQRPGTYVAPLNPGRWQVHVDVVADGHRWRTVSELAGGTGS
ncbi:integral membrane protein linked to a cation pump-like protein [Novosphingobium nitrogenifigens DSM 19370]|uniref:Integral membrane protein linked to a cation pump-like protein n=1 Tax=Novosphingobium nitrogenifigens DSM 19370 TaxID=983920 RepID=F1Z8A8_9SPHN|nr:FixH family protein [Novosphingobium nitrogenifigens]EGD59117.1 integral membrane protein linked to a cation pump-like protein [Novosphingobium nitrogenifigens DSM 19370]